MRRILILLLLVLPLGAYGQEAFDRIALTVNNQAITANEIEARSKDLALAKGAAATEEAKAKLKAEAVESLITDALLVSRAMEKKIEIGDAAVEEELENFLKSRGMNRAGLEAMLEAEGISIVDYKNRVRLHLMREQLVWLEVEAQVVLEDAEIKRMFEKNGGKTKAIHARHILFLLTENAPPHLVEEARLKALEVRQKILKGLRFSEAARQFSEDPSAQGNAGDLGFFTQGQMVPEFEAVAFNLPPLQVSDPVRTKFGYHLVEVLEVRYDQAQSFEMIKEQFKRTAFKDAYEQRFQKFLAQLRSKAEIHDYR